jgi:hypothetical protein
VIVRIRWSTNARRSGARFRRIRTSFLAAALLATGIPKRTVADVRQTPMRRDSAIEWLTAFMRARDFTQPYYAQEILDSSKRHNLPASLLVCIEFFESSGGKTYDRGTSNPFGWRNGKKSFPSRPAAIDYISTQLELGRYYAGKCLLGKLRVYNPRPAYARKVMSCMKELAAAD